MDDLNGIANLIQSLGMWAVFLWLYLNERKEHKETSDAHKQDLRDFARSNSGV